MKMARHAEAADCVGWVFPASGIRKGGRCPAYALACHARSEVTRCDLSPEGAAVCSHGWNAAQPVDGNGEYFAPAGAKGISPRNSAILYGEFPPPLRGGHARSILSTGYARPPAAGLASPVATVLRPVGAGSRARRSPNLIDSTHGTFSPSPCTQGEGRGEGSSTQRNDAVRVNSVPHPNPLPEYMERGPERNPCSYRACLESP